ncbi:Leucine-rich repeat-containing protein, partial [Cynara cardunculus var. scolymus]
MDNLVKFSLRGSGIEIVPSSIGQYCNNLVSLDLSNLQPGAVNEFLGFRRFLRRLSLRGCNLVDDDITSFFCEELSNLQVLDLSSNGFSRLPSSLSQLSHLKFIDLSLCYSLVELPDLPSSIYILIARGCTSLKIGDFPTNHLKWLWKVTLPPSNYNGESVLQSMLQVYLHSIEGNFHLLKHLQMLYLDGCDQLKNMPTEGLFNAECYLNVLSLSLNNLQPGAVNGFLGFPRSLRRLNLGGCNLVDEDISSVFWEELSNLQVLDLSKNAFSRLPSSLSQLPHLKVIDLFGCYNLVELTDLPSSISVLIACGCTSLKIGDFPTNHHKWLWKVTLSTSNCNGERVLQSMLQGNAIEDYFISILFEECYVPIRGFALGTFTLQLPWNWYNEFSGFLVYVDKVNWLGDGLIVIKDVLGRENEDDALEVSNKTEHEEETMRAEAICYISFGSLRNTSWWNSTHTTLSLSFRSCVKLKVELVPRRSQGDDDSTGIEIGRAKD